MSGQPDPITELYARFDALGIAHKTYAHAPVFTVEEAAHLYESQPGGHTKNPLLMELYADATGCTVVEPLADDAVLIGTGMVAATAAGLYPSLPAACVGMRQDGRRREANPAAGACFDRDYRIFLEMHRQRRALDRIG